MKVYSVLYHILNIEKLLFVLILYQNVQELKNCAQGPIDIDKYHACEVIPPTSTKARAIISIDKLFVFW